MRPLSNPIVLLVALAIIWSIVFALIKVVIVTIPPFTAATLRLMLAGAFLYAVLKFRGERLVVTPRQWVLLVAVGITGNAFPFVLINWGESVVDSGLTAILMGTVPLLTMVLAHYVVPGESLTPSKVAGIGIGLAGLGVLMGAQWLDGFGKHLVAESAIVAAAASYAVSNVLAARITGLGILPTTIGATIAAAVTALPFALVFEAPWRLSPSIESLAATVAIGIVSTAIGNLLFFRIVALAGATFFSLCNYIIPVLGVIWGVLFLAESVSVQAGAALGLILSGVAVTSNAALRRRRAGEKRLST
ncbi:MAG: DMT family transporter [Alphaproteobacteria bacterium]|nr:DMT family transporter [Alphaproteobacteria bacterium]